MAWCLKLFKRRRNSSAVDPLGLGGSSGSSPGISIPLQSVQPMPTAIMVLESSPENRPSPLPDTGDPVPPIEPTPIATVAQEHSAESHVSSSQDPGLLSSALPTPITTVIDESGAGNRDSSSPDIAAPPGSGSHFAGAHHFTLNYPTFVEVHGGDKVRRVMEMLSTYVMDGATQNDASRKYRPRCHPGTREGILKWLLAWFKDPSRSESLFHLTGPAGVGKSAVMQTYTEKADHPVILVFISRPNQCNNPNQVFTTIGYRLAASIEAYRNYIVNRIAADPLILKTDMETQFQIFIIEPFGIGKIGVDGPPLAILLDGLDELDGANAQRLIIRLIGRFMQDYPDAPLAWIIASRPELHITNTLKETRMQGRFKSYTISIDDSDGVQDVVNFLSASFDDMKHDFDGIIPTNWPAKTDVTKLETASSGLFIFAATAVRFITDPEHGDPASRLSLVLSVIDRSKGVPSEEQPFRNLDNLYTEILSKIPVRSLPAAKRLLALALAFRGNQFLGLYDGLKSLTLGGMVVILQLDLDQIYPALIKCISTLKVPRREEVHKMPLTFLHASFADYLVDERRSGKFYIDVDSTERNLLLGYLKLWDRYCGEESAAGAKFITAGMPELPEEEIVTFTRDILAEMGETLLTEIVNMHKPREGLSSQLHQNDNELFDALSTINMIRLCNFNDGLWGAEYSFMIVYIFAWRVFQAWKESPDKLGKSGMFRAMYYKQIDVDFNDDQKYMVEMTHHCYDGGHFHVIDRATKRFLRKSPNLQVLICGAVPGGQVAIFAGDHKGDRYCIVPYHPRGT